MRVPLPIDVGAVHETATESTDGVDTKLVGGPGGTRGVGRVTGVDITQVEVPSVVTALICTWY